MPTMLIALDIVDYIVALYLLLRSFIVTYSRSDSSSVGIYIEVNHIGDPRAQYWF